MFAIQILPALFVASENSLETSANGEIKPDDLTAKRDQIAQAVADFVCKPDIADGVQSDCVGTIERAAGITGIGVVEVAGALMQPADSSLASLWR